MEIRDLRNGYLPPAMSEPIRVVYADDHNAVRAGVTALINATATCRVILEASDGAALLVGMADLSILPDVCLLDVFMPGMNGLQTLQALKRNYPQVRVLVLTGHNTEYHLIRLIAAGAAGYLLKNCSPRELEAAILAAHHEGIYYADEGGGGTAETIAAIRSGKLAVPDLSEAEEEFLALCCTDLSYVQIAERMGITQPSVDWKRVGLFKKLGVVSRSGLVMYAVQTGLVPINEKAEWE